LNWELCKLLSIDATSRAGKKTHTFDYEKPASATATFAASCGCNQIDKNNWLTVAQLTATATATATATSTLRLRSNSVEFSV